MKTKAELEKRQKELWKVQDQTNAELAKNRKQIDDLRFKELSPTLSNLTPKKVMKLDSYEAGNSSKIYNALKKYFKKYEGRGVKRSGCYSTEHPQILLEVCMDQNKPFEDQLGILDFLPYLNKKSAIKIFEYTLSEGGIFELRAKGDGAELWKTTYGRLMVLQEFPTWKAALRYVYDNHPYERKEDESGDDPFLYEDYEDKY